MCTLLHVNEADQNTKHTKTHDWYIHRGLSLYSKQNYFAERGDLMFPRDVLLWTPQKNVIVTFQYNLMLYICILSAASRLQNNRMPRSFGLHVAESYTF